MNKKTPTSSAKSTRSARQCSESTGPRASSSTTSGLLPTPEALNQEGYQVMRGKRYMRLGSAINLFSSLADSPANPSAKPDEERERKMTATSGLSCLRLYEVGNRHGSLLRTCVASLLKTEAWYSSKCALTWKASVTKSNRLLFQLSPLTRPTEGIGSGLLPTASARGGEHGTDRKLVDGKNQSKKGVVFGITTEQAVEAKWKSNWLEVATRLCRVDAKLSYWVDGRGKRVNSRNARLKVFG